MTIKQDHFFSELNFGQPLTSCGKCQTQSGIFRLIDVNHWTWALSIFFFFLHEDTEMIP